MIVDDTAQISVTFFSPIADSLTKMECKKMVTELGYDDPRILPDPIINLRGTKKIFQIHFNQRNAGHNIDFIADKVIDITDQLQQEDQPQLKSSTPPRDLQITPLDQKTAHTSTEPKKRKFPSNNKETERITQKTAKRALFPEPKGTLHFHF